TIPPSKNGPEREKFSIPMRRGATARQSPPPSSFARSPEREAYRSPRRSPLLPSPERGMTTAELIAKLKSDDPHRLPEVVIWESDEELTRGVERVALRDDRVVVVTSRQAQTKTRLASSARPS